MSYHGCDHAVETAFARYGVWLSTDDFAAMVADIVLAMAGDRREALLLCRPPLSSREIWLARVPEGPAVRVVYEPRVAMIIAILPPKWRIDTTVQQ